MIRYNNSGATIRIMAIFVIKLRNTESIESNNNDSNYYHVRWPFFFFLFFTETRPVVQLAPKSLIKVRRRPIFPRFSLSSSSWPLYISLPLFLSSCLLLLFLSSLRPCPCFYPFYFCNRTPRAYAPTFWHGDVTALVPPRLRITDTTWLRLIYKPVMSLWNTAS